MESKRLCESRTIKRGSLFSGIGGFDLAAQWCGWENVFHCETDLFCNELLKYYWPNAQSYEDIKTTDFSSHRGCIDVLTGGFPCQPFSIAGKRLGKQDERHLWPFMLNAVRQIKPKWVVGENVLGITSWNEGLVFEEVCADLEAEGSQVQAHVLPAAGVNAPHCRYRVWFVAYCGDYQCEHGPKADRREKSVEEGDKIWHYPAATTEGGDAPDPLDSRCNDRCNYRQERYFQGNERTAEEDQSERQERQCRTCKTCAPATNATGEGLERQACLRVQDRARRNPSIFHKQFAGAGGIGRWENFPQTEPTICIGDDGLPIQLDAETIFEGIPFPIKPISFSKWRTESVKALGNAIVPQVVLQIFKTIQHITDQELNTKS